MIDLCGDCGGLIRDSRPPYSTECQDCLHWIRCERCNRRFDPEKGYKMRCYDGQVECGRKDFHQWHEYCSHVCGVKMFEKAQQSAKG